MGAKGVPFPPQASFPTNCLTGFSYDASGNTTSDGINSHVYDSENQIVTAAGVTYTYDGDGARVKKSSGRLYWDGVPGIIAESDLSGNLTAEYVFFDGERVARRDLPSGAVHYYFSDHLKSVSVVTNATGSAIEEESDYHTWGEERVITHTLADQHFKFNGKERDPETGFDEFGARLYSSAWSRWLTPDWSANPTPVPYAQMDNPQSLNLYAYVLNNPTTFPDLDGHLAAGGKETCQGDQGHCADTATPNDAQVDKVQQFMDQAKAEFAAMKANPKDAAIGTGKQVLNELNNITPGGMSTSIFFGDPFPATNGTQAAAMKVTSFAVLLVPVGGEEAAAAKAEAKAERVFVYVIKEGERIVYAGITNNLKMRGAKHGAELLELLRNLSRKDARAAEQVLIKRLGLQKNGGQLRNKINSIAERNPIFKEAIKRGEKLLEGIPLP